MWLWDKAKDLVATSKSIFQHKKFKPAVGTFVTASNTALAGAEVALFARILQGRSPAYLFDGLVTLIGMVNLPMPLLAENTKQKVNNFIGGWGTTALAIKALHPTPEGIKPPEFFAAALVLNTASSILDGMLKTCDGNKLSWLEVTAKSAATLKNAFITAVVLMGPELGQIIPGEVFENLGNEPENITVNCYFALSLSFIVAVLGAAKLKTFTDVLMKQEESPQLSAIQSDEPPQLVITVSPPGERAQESPKGFLEGNSLENRQGFGIDVMSALNQSLLPSDERSEEESALRFK